MSSYTMQVPKRITHRVYHQEMQKRATDEAKRNALLSTIQASSDLKAQADGEQRADNLKRRNMAAAQAAEMGIHCSVRPLSRHRRCCPLPAVP